MVQDGLGSSGMVSLISLSYSMPVFSANSFGLFVYNTNKYYEKTLESATKNLKVDILPTNICIGIYFDPVPSNRLYYLIST